VPNCACRPVTAEAAGSSPVIPAILFSELEGMAAKIPIHNSTPSITAPSTRDALFWTIFPIAEPTAWRSSAMRMNSQMRYQRRIP
jgi:hypothetical protein